MNTPLHEIQSWSDIRAGTPLFESLVVFENYLLDSYFRKKGGSWLNREFIYRGRTNYPLTLIGYADNKLLLRIEYDEARLIRYDTQNLVSSRLCLMTLLQSEAQIADLPLLTAEERKRILVEWNNTHVEISEGCMSSRLFEKQVERTPDRTAVEFGNRSLTYKEFNERSNQLAHYLQRLGVGPERLVGVCMEVR